MLCHKLRTEAVFAHEILLAQGMNKLAGIFEVEAIQILSLVSRCSDYGMIG